MKKVEVFLFGKKKDCLGWIEFLKSEMVPFRYGGESADSRGAINILAGCSRAGKDEIRVLGKDDVAILRGNVSADLVRDYSFSTFQEMFVQREFSMERMRECLLKAFSLAGLPYVHLWYYPFPSPTILLFRQDIDYVKRRGMRELIGLTDKFAITGTYFVNISGEEEYDETIGHLKLDKPTTPRRSLPVREALERGNELANHGYWHCLFDGMAENLDNIKKGNAYLKKIFGVNAEGFASPGAEWNSNLLKALEKSGLLYACNGCSDSVGLPFHPYLGLKRLKFLEMVFYKICDASFEPIMGDGGSLTEQEAEILSEIIENYADGQIKKNRPIAVLGHPNLSGNVAQEVYLPLFRKIRRLKIPSLTIAEFSKWWIKREGIRLDYFIDGGKLTLRATEPVFVRMIYKGKSKILKIG